MLSIYFREDKTRCIVFGTKLKRNIVNKFDIRYEEMHIKKYHTVTDLLIYWVKIFLESMALKVSNKINSRLRFLYRKNRFLFPPHLTGCFVTPAPFRLRLLSLVPQL